MRLLHHLALSPSSRKIRIQLKEKGLEFELKAEKPWERQEAFLALNPAGEVPVLIEPSGNAILGSSAIAEYLEETNPAPPLLGGDPLARAETRRLIAWFDEKFNREVTVNLFEEKLMKRLTGHGQPDSGAIRAGLANIHYHLDYIGWLSDRRKWLAGESFSLADIVAAAHLSSLDYIGDVPWDKHETAKNWYARVKSRPSFRPILADHVPGVPPPSHYADLDF